MMGKQKDESVHHMMLRILAHWSGQTNVLTIPRSLVQLTGSLEAALFLSQCLYWTGKSTAYADGWFFKSYREWQEEICLSKYHVQQAAALLESRGWLETDVSYAAGHPTRHYRVILEKLLDDIQVLFDVPEPEPPAAGLADVGVQSIPIGENLPMEPNRPVDNLQNAVSIGENLPMDRQKFANGRQKFANGRQKFANVTETTTETSAKISAEITVSADGAPHADMNRVLVVEPEPEPEPEPKRSGNPQMAVPVYLARSYASRHLLNDDAWYVIDNLNTDYTDWRGVWIETLLENQRFDCVRDVVSLANARMLQAQAAA